MAFRTITGASSAQFVDGVGCRRAACHFHFFPRFDPGDMSLSHELLISPWRMVFRPTFVRRAIGGFWTKSTAGWIHVTQDISMPRGEHWRDALALERLILDMVRARDSGNIPRLSEILYEAHQEIVDANLRDIKSEFAPRK